MSSKKYRDIKITSGGKFHAMGLVVDTFDQAFDRCLEKTKAAPDEWCTLIIAEDVPTPLRDKIVDMSMYVAGGREYLKQWTTALSQ